jgi:ABC-type transport system involved in multi-copper enzyme maturation permease subunit
MLRIKGILILTLREHLRGQLLWVSAFVSVLLLLLATFLSGVALTHEARVLDVFSYYAIDQILIFLGIFAGASIFSQDFSSRGIAELLIPSGYSRQTILIVRVLGFALILLSVAFLLFTLKSFLLPFFAEFPQAPNRTAHLVMFLFSYLKSVAGLLVATFIGCLTRPVFAVLGAITLFSLGHLTASLDTLFAAGEGIQSTNNMSALSAALYQLFSFWNPGVLVLESFKGEWVLPNTETFVSAFLWAAGVVLVSLVAAVTALTRVDIKA